MSTRAPEVRICKNQEAAVPLLLQEVRPLASPARRALLGLATGSTFTKFLQALAEELRAGHTLADNLVATHLDEYAGFAPDRVGGMVHELGTHCPPLLTMLARGTFVPVPYVGDAGLLRAHAERLQQLGGVQVQFLGIGRNGHLAFNEPGTAFDSGFHVTTLAETTREDARPRFLPAEPPAQAVTSGLATILAAKRLVLCAFGKAKAAAVRAMLQGEVSTKCPASVLQNHGNVLVLLDPEAASGLGGAASAS